MHLRRLPVIIATPLARSPRTTARRNAFRAAVEVDRRQRDRECDSESATAVSPRR